MGGPRGVAAVTMIGSVFRPHRFNLAFLLIVFLLCSPDLRSGQSLLRFCQIRQRYGALPCVCSGGLPKHLPAVDWIGHSAPPGDSTMACSKPGRRGASLAPSGKIRSGVEGSQVSKPSALGDRRFTCQCKNGYTVAAAFVKMIPFSL